MAPWQRASRLSPPPAVARFLFVDARPHGEAIEIAAPSDFGDSMRLLRGPCSNFSQGCCRYPILGNAEDVVRPIKQLHDSGIDAILMVLESYYDDLARFEREIMPGLRALNVIA